MLDAGRRVRLRAVAAADLPTLFAYQADAESCRMASVHPRSERAFYDKWDEILRDAGVTARAVLADQALVGSISCFGIEGQDYIGYWIGREHWGKGFATRALRLLLEEVSTRPLFARVATHNPGSLRVLGRCGFVEIDRRRSPGTERFMERDEALLRLD